MLSILALASCDRVFGLERTPDAPPPRSRWDAISGGELHACGIRLDHTLWCWGRNDHGELGVKLNLADWEADEPRQVGTETNWTMVSAGLTTNCAIKDDQTLWCFGDNSLGQAGIGIVSGGEAVIAPAQVIDTWKSVSVGELHTCGIRADDSLACWGANSQGQLGDTTTTARATPVTVAPGTTWVAVAVGGQFTCALKSDQTAWCWGLNSRGQLGLGTTTQEPAPKPLGPTQWRTITAGLEFACGVQMDGKLRCWGHNQRGELGDNSGSDHTSPVPVGGDQIVDWTEVHAGREHACGLHGDGELACWGSNEHGQLVTDLARSFETGPSAIDGTWVHVATTAHATCAIDRDARLFCAGYGPAGALGDGTGTPLTLTQRPGTWTHVGAGRNVTCGLQGSAISCWGDNALGAIGDGTRNDRQAPVPVAGSFSSFSVFDHVCAITSGGSLSCWGANNQGQAGVGGVADQLTPMTIGTAAWSMTSSGKYNGCGIAQTVQLWCWGYNKYGELNRAPMMPMFSSIPLQAGNTWNSAASGGYHTCAIDPGHAIECWGYGFDGQLGNGAQGPIEVPQLVTVPGNPMFDIVQAGERFTCGHTTGNKLWCWGSNVSGQLGDLTTEMRMLPEQVPGDWPAIGTGGIRPDRSLWCWGDNRFGELGDGTLIERHEPTRVGTDADWAEVSGGDDHTCARKQNGDLWCWGSNASGALGDGTAWRASFVEVTK